MTAMWKLVGPRLLLFAAAALAFGVLYGVVVPELPDESIARRYLAGHPIEAWTVALFLCGLAMLGDRAWFAFLQRIALTRLTMALQRHVPLGNESSNDSWSYVGRRLTLLKEAQAKGRSRQEYVELLRDLADADEAALERRALGMRFVTWAIPIFGFLGTVLGITAAIAHVTPEQLQESLSTVTQGLAVAFDTTALALALSVVLMAGNAVVERFERGTLAAADEVARFQLASLLPERSDERETVRKAESVAEAVTAAIARQWKAEREAWMAAARDVAQQQAQLLQEATGRTLEQLRLYGVREREQWQELTRAACDGLQAAIAQGSDALGRQLDLAVRAVGRQLEQSIEQLQGPFNLLHDALAAHAERISRYLSQLQQTREHLELVARRLEEAAQAHASILQRADELAALQRTLAQNIELLTRSATLDETLNTLTAAVHLLTARAGARPDREAA